MTNTIEINTTEDYLNAMGAKLLPVAGRETYAVSGFNDHGQSTTTFYTRNGAGPNAFRVNEIINRGV